VAYDPTFAYELVVIIHDGLRRMAANQENVFYYITTMNENYAHPPMPAGVEAAIRRGMYLLHASSDGTSPAVQLLGCGTILRECLAAADLLQRLGVGADVWSVTSFHELRREGLSIERRNRLHPEAAPEVPYVTQCLGARTGPVIAATDYVKSFAEAIRAFVPRRYVTLGTDGFGRSDTRPALRRFFEVDRHHIAVAALKALADEGKVPASRVTEAIRAFDIDPEAPDPATL
jgi:pyruvate dehydrogenase E1 component